MSERDLIGELIAALRCLPGVGPKSAQRMSYHLLERDRSGARRLSQALTQAAERVGHCTRCRTLTEREVCALCTNASRDPALLCIVETPADVLAVEQASAFRGHYFVLMGHLSPLDGIGPADLGLDQLVTRVSEGVHEVIVATNPTVEGEATAHYIAELLRPQGVRVSRIAHGVPMGGELEYVDVGTMAHALSGRRVM